MYLRETARVCDSRPDGKNNKRCAREALGASDLFFVPSVGLGKLGGPETVG